MTKIICGVLSCYLNKDKCCCADSISVKGEAAKSRGKTCCETYGERKSSLSNSIQNIKENADISCEAEKCVHNENNKCQSRTIQIHGSDVVDCEETFCTTFRLK